tara:strand:+ start:10133 stop:11836 length:1704 start_codon:yes stop_codon:yes gene_type:complete
MAKAKAFITRHPALTTVIVVLMAAFFMGAKWFEPSEDTSARLQFVKVERGNFKITVEEGGTLDSTSKKKLECELDGGGVIVDLVAEGTYVKGPVTHVVASGDTLQSLARQYEAQAEGAVRQPAREFEAAMRLANPDMNWGTLESGQEILIPGNLLVKFEDGALKEKIHGQEKAVIDAERDLANARKDLRLRKLETAAADEQAVQDVEFARQDLQKYVEGDYPLLQLQLDNSIDLAEEEIQRAEERLTLTRRLLEKGYATPSQVKIDELSIKRERNLIEKTKREKALLEKFDKPQMEARYRSKLKQAELQEIRTKNKSEAVVQSQAEVVERREQGLAAQKEKLALYKDQLAKTEMRAPQDGLVIYALSSSSRYSSSPIEKGYEVRKGYDVIMLPDVSQMMAVVRVHESQVRNVSRNQPAVVRIDALPDREFKAVVRKVAPTPDRMIRYYEDISVYNTEVWIEDDGNALPEDLKPGVSAKAEIIIAKLEDVLKVPVQCVITHQGQTKVMIRQGDQAVLRTVEVGRASSTFIEIKSGLRKGDEVALSPELPENDTQNKPDKHPARAAAGH